MVEKWSGKMAKNYGKLRQLHRIPQTIIDVNCIFLVYYKRLCLSEKSDLVPMSYQFPHATVVIFSAYLLKIQQINFSDAPVYQHHSSQRKNNCTVGKLISFSSPFQWYHCFRCAIIVAVCVIEIVNL